jgi:ParB family chromosome partitioning protein
MEVIMAKSGLGKGLETLFPSNVDVNSLGNVSRETNEKIIELKVKEIEPDVNQPRKTFDDEKLSDLTDSIKEHGVIQPIIVAKKGLYYQIIAGERRWRASKKAGLKTIPAIIREYDSKKSREVSLIENIQRQDLNAIETAKAIKELMEAHSITQEQLSKTLGKSRSSIANTLRILNLDMRVQDLVKQGKISEGHARSLVAIESPQKQYKLALDIVNLDLSVRDVESIAKDEKNGSRSHEDTKKGHKNSKLEAIYKDLENRFKRYFGTKVTFKPTAKSKGKIVIEYFSNEELERIIDLVSES